MVRTGIETLSVRLHHPSSDVIDVMTGRGRIDHGEPRE